MLSSRFDGPSLSLILVLSSNRWRKQNCLPGGPQRRTSKVSKWLFRFGNMTAIHEGYDRKSNKKLSLYVYESVTRFG